MNKGEKRSKAEFDILARIREERDKRGWTDYTLAENSELAQSTISTWYSRDIEPGVASIEKVCSGLGISLAQFFQKEDEECVFLSEEQAGILSLWSKLSKEQRVAVRNLIEAFIKSE